MVGKDFSSLMWMWFLPPKPWKQTCWLKDNLQAFSHTRLLQRELKRGFTENKLELKNMFKYKCSLLKLFSVHLSFISNSSKISSHLLKAKYQLTIMCLLQPLHLYLGLSGSPARVCTFPRQWHLGEERVEAETGWHWETDTFHRGQIARRSIPSAFTL